MDIWLLLCMIFVASAIFEYATLLAIRYDKGRKINGWLEVSEDKQDKCNKIDKLSLTVFLCIYVHVVAAYFLFVTQM